VQARRYLISGRVQGVGFRDFVQRLARDMKITGWTRNLDDGSVEVHANGAPAVLEDFEMRLRAGPRHADVRGVQVREDAVSDGSGFHIRY
jgi:acylphosphatase